MMSTLDDALKNGTAPLGDKPQAYQPPAQLLTFAQSLVEEVKSGQITSLLAVKVGPMGQTTWPAWGMQASELMIGAEMFRDDAKTMMRGQGQQKGRIIRAG